MTLGPLMIDVAGFSLAQGETVQLQDPRVGGVILFSRNLRACRNLKIWLDRYMRYASRNFSLPSIRRVAAYKGSERGFQHYPRRVGSAINTKSIRSRVENLRVYAAG